MEYYLQLKGTNFWYVAQPQKHARHKRPCIVWLHLNKMSKKGNSIEIESRLVFAWSEGQESN